MFALKMKIAMLFLDHVYTAVCSVGNVYELWFAICCYVMPLKTVICEYIVMNYFFSEMSKNVIQNVIVAVYLLQKMSIHSFSFQSD